MPFGVPGRIGWESIAEMLNPEEWEGFLNFFRGGDAEYIPGRDPSYDLRIKTKKNAAEAFDRLGNDIIGAIVGEPEGIPVTQPQTAMAQDQAAAPEEVVAALGGQRGPTVPTNPRSLGLLAPDPMRQRALESIADRESSEAERAAKEQAAKDYLKQLSEARAQDKWVRSVGYEPDPTLSEPDKKILFENVSPEKLAKIRMQALAKGGGTRGAGGGTLSIAPDSPEIQQRLAARDEWLAQQPMRDAMFESDLARQRRDLPGQELAANKILKLKEQGIIDKRQAVVDRLVQSLGDGTGKIPFEKAMQLEMAGIDIPYQARGISREQALTGLDNEIAALQGELSNIASKGQSFQATEMDQLEYQFGMSALAKMQMYRNMVAQGRMTPDEAAQAIQQTIRDRARELQGVLQYSAPQVIGEAPGVE